MGVVTWGSVVHNAGKYVKPKPDYKGTVVWPTMVDDLEDELDSIPKEGVSDDKQK